MKASRVHFGLLTASLLTAGATAQSADTPTLKDAYKHEKAPMAIIAAPPMRINDGVSWRANGKPLLFDGNDQPKAAFDAVIRAAKGN